MPPARGTPAAAAATVTFGYISLYVYLYVMSAVTFGYISLYVCGRASPLLAERLLREVLLLLLLLLAAAAAAAANATNDTIADPKP